MNINDKLYGFTVKSVKVLDEIEATVYELTHDKTGLELIWSERNDENKTFGIAFRTIPEDSTGVFHILEHSVLCGSDKYPVKEPFVELLKSSMNTFLNAMTFPDKTFYPVCSRNDKDFMNLMNVYLDAVFHPAIYTNPNIFRQEGWHYEVSDNAEPVFKGVVFNEMKGAFASADTILTNELTRLLFPDNCYAFVSGGDPVNIPDLTYENFINNHKKFYAPSNARVWLDGKMDFDTVLSAIAGYLEGYEKTEIPSDIPMQKPVNPALSVVEYDVAAEESLEDKSRFAKGSVYGTFSDRKTLIAMGVLADILCGTNDSPLSKAIMDKEIAKQVSLRNYDGILQPFCWIELKELADKYKDTAEQCITDALKDIVKNGLDHERITATLCNWEFNYRERDFGGYPTGLVMAMNALDTWLYGGDATMNLQVGTVFDDLRKEVENNYFEGLIEKYLINNNHCCSVLMVPSHTVGDKRRNDEAERIKKAAAAWTEDEKEALKKQQAEIDAWQQSEDSPENLAKLPKLSISDIEKKTAEVPTEETTVEDIKFVLHKLPTNGISYVNLFIDISDFSKEDLIIANFLTELVGEFGTKSHTVNELQILSNLKLGGWGFNISTYGKYNTPSESKTFYNVNFKALEANLKDGVDIINEKLFTTKWDDNKRISEKLSQLKMVLSKNLTVSGHAKAIAKASAGITVEGNVNEIISGYTYYSWIKDFAEHFDEKIDYVKERLAFVVEKLAEKQRLTVTVTNSNPDCETIAKAMKEYCIKDYVKASDSPVGVGPVAHFGCEIPSDVSYATSIVDFNKLGIKFSGKMVVLSNIVSLAFLWNEVRVKGGAYGAGLLTTNNGYAATYSYRDPKPSQSLETYKKIGEFIKAFCANGADISGFIFGAISSTDPLRTVRAKGDYADQLYFKGISYEDVCRGREEIITATAADMLALAEVFEKLDGTDGTCVFGPAVALEACKDAVSERVAL